MKPTLLIGFAARATAAYVFRSPASTASQLHAFAAAEQASVLDLLEAAHGTRDVQRKAAYLAHAVDESMHARIFSSEATRLVRAHGLAPLPAQHADTEALFRSLGETDFLAFVTLGERRGRLQFEVYERHFRARAEGRLAGIFERILRDERRHERDALTLLTQQSSSPSRRMWRMQLRRGWRSQRRVASALSTRLFAILAGALLLLALPLRFFLEMPSPGFDLASTSSRRPKER